MPWNVWTLFCWALPVLGSRGPIDMPFSRDMTNSESENVVQFKWGYDREMQEISIEIQTPLATWVVLGLSPDAKMNTTDFVVAGWDKEDQSFFYVSFFILI